MDENQENDNRDEDNMSDESNEVQESNDRQNDLNSSTTDDVSIGPGVIADEPGIALASDVLPENILILPIQQRPLFPGLTVPLQIGSTHVPKIVEALNKQTHSVVGLVLTKESQEDDPLLADLYDYGTAARVLRFGEMDGSIQILVQTLRRFRVISEEKQDILRFWKVKYFEDRDQQPGDDLKAYTMAILSSVKDLLKLNPLFQEQLKMLLVNFNYNQPGLIMDLTASMLTAEGEKLQEILETIPLLTRAEKLLRLMREEIQLLNLQEKIKKSIEEKISKQQKEFFLREQLKAIKHELGLEKDDREAELEKFQERLKDLKPDKEALKVIQSEMEKLTLLEPASPEYTVSRNYLDWLTSIPWGVYSEDSFDIKKAREILDRDHYGLDDVKERILEFISTGWKTGHISGSIVCFVGPPGVGKTSIGRSVAEALNRKFYRFSLGGMRDEAEIKGHRRTYIGAMPGKFIQSLKTVGTANPVIMLDEIDKVGKSFQGDPASALLEVLDPAQNADFLDHYLDVRFDLSRILFITTANQLDTIPPALMDRMEVIKLAGYIMEEKIQIARRYLIPRALSEHGLKETDVEITEDGLRFIIDRYAREAGVRNLENRIKKIMRKTTLFHAEGRDNPARITVENIPDYLGQPVFPEEMLYNKSTPGVVIGLAWTSMGGATLHIEATDIKSEKGSYKQTGQLGDVMKESAEIAYSYIRAQAERYGIGADYFDRNFIHLHVPAGATPKDGPSAGVTMALAIYSLARKLPVRSGIAMTGELTLTGKVLPVGGIKEKIIAARRVEIMELILPRDNLKDYKELPDYIRQGMKVYFVNYFDDVIKICYDGNGVQSRTT
ncbi:MAG: endopeptidase La [Leptospiraceae bacterium]|nr:endopeptidase La [Leptospiraceae bacterium]